MLMFAPYLATLSEENSQKTPLVPTRQREPASDRERPVRCIPMPVLNELHRIRAGI